jgi:hypothetical protein
MATKDTRPSEPSYRPPWLHLARLADQSFRYECGSWFRPCGWLRPMPEDRDAQPGPGGEGGVKSLTRTSRQTPVVTNTQIPLSRKRS